MANDNAKPTNQNPSSVYIERNERRELFNQSCLDAWHHYQATGKHLSAEEADAWLSMLESGQDAEPPECHS